MATQDYYNPDELVDYLSRANTGAGYTPSFSNIPSEVEQGQGKVFGVGIKRTPAGKWEKVQTDAAATDPATPPISGAQQQVNPTGMPDTDMLNMSRLRKADLQQQINNMEANAGSEWQPEVERLSNSYMMLQRNTQGSQQMQDKYGPQMASAREGLQMVVELQEKAKSDVVTDPEYQALQGQLLQEDTLIQELTPRAAREQQMKVSMEALKAKESFLTEQDRVNMVEAVSPQMTDAAYLVLGTPDAANAKEQVALNPTSVDPNAMIVINEMARNSQQPALNTPLANMSKPNEQFHWYGEAYKNGIEKTDAYGLVTAETLLNEMNALRAQTAAAAQTLLAESTEMTSLTKDIDAAKGGTEATRAAMGYDAMLFQKKNMEKQLLADFYHTRVIKPLKQTLVDTNIDLLTIPVGLQGAVQPIASAFISTVTASSAATLADATQQFYATQLPTLIEKGFTQSTIISTVQSILETYMNSVNNRHELSGVEIGVTDLPTAPSFSLFNPNQPIPNLGASLSQFGDL